MAYTHKYKFEVGDYTFKGDIEYSNAGLVAYEEDSNPAMPKKVADALKQVLSILGVLPETYSDLKLFKIDIKEE